MVSPATEDAAGPVKHEGALSEEDFDLFAGLLHEIGSRLESREPEEARTAL